MNYEMARAIFKDEYSLNPEAQSQRTHDFHDENQNYFGYFLIARKPHLFEHVEMIIPEDLKDYLKYMKKEKSLKDSTINGRVKTLRVFFNNLQSAGVMEDIAKDFRYNIKRNQNIVPFSPQQLDLWFKACGSNSLKDLRMTACSYLLLDSGMRVEEFHNLNVGDVNLVDKRSFVRIAKENRPRIVKFGLSTRKALIKYCKAFRIDPNDLNDPLFQTLKGDRWAIRSIQCDMTNLGIKAGIKNVRCSPHTLRHSCAISFLLNGGTEAALRKLFGHLDDKTLKIYTNITGEFMEQLYISNVDEFVKRDYNPDRLFSKKSPSS